MRGSLSDRLVYILLGLLALILLGMLLASWRVVLYPFLVVIGVSILFGFVRRFREGEFFVCGDNSPKSLDSRLWPLERPVVPRRNLVGKAFFVYWPAAGTRWHIPLAPDPTGWRLVH